MNIIKKGLIVLIVFFSIIFIKNTVYARTYDVNDTIQDGFTISMNDVMMISERDLSYVSQNNDVVRDNLYCVALDKNFGYNDYWTELEFKVVQHISIKGDTAVGENGVTSVNNSNAILSAILAGPLDKGYGRLGHYNEAQQALYLYWDEWVKNVGSSVFGLYDFAHNSGNLGKPIGDDAAKHLQEAKNAAKNSYGVEIYCLRYCGDLGVATTQEVILVFPSKEPPEEVTPVYDGYITISGKVWVDGAAGKSNNINGKYNESDGDTTLEGIKVTLRDKNGKEFTGGSHATTDSSGNYKIVVNYDSSKKVYKLYDNPDTVMQKLKDGAYVEFEYDGIKYTTVSTSNTGANTSKAAEDSSKRINFDNNHTIINPNTNTTGLMLTATTKNVISNLGTYSDTSEENQTVTILYCNADGSKTTNSDTPPKGTYIQTNTSGAWLDPQISQNNMHNVGQDGQTWYWCSEGHVLDQTTITNLHIKNINLGLFEREQPDIALTSDIQQVDVTMKDQKYSYVYGNKGIDSTDNFFDTQVKFQNKYTYTYKRPVNPADIAYVNNNNTNDLQVQVTYKIVFKNQSTTLPVTVRELINYYDLEYTILECKVDSQNKNNTEQPQGQEYKSTIFNDLNIIIEPQDKAELTIKYDISQSAIKGLLTEEATLNNIVEIYSYSTQYGSNTLCAGQKTAEQIGKTGYAYAGVDVDSQPGNAKVYFDKDNNRLDSSNYQDDTDIAPSFVLVKDEEHFVSGNIWEDKATEESIANNERLGNGIKDDDENIVANVKVELYQVNDDGTIGDLAKLYVIEGNTPVEKDAVTYSDESGNYSFPGIVIGRYIIKYTYGDDNINGGATTINGNAINARNYKSTIITTEPIKSVMNGTNVSDTWYLTTQDNASIAVDDLEERANIDSQSLINKNFADKKNISAYSKPFKMLMEFTEDQTINVDANGGDLPKELSVFDFAIIERPRENLVIDKTMSNLKITLANGQILIDGNPYTDDLDYVKALGNTITSRDVRVRDKLVSIEIDTELIHGAKIDMTYAITATNNSEYDYDYTQGNSYYYFGDKSSLPLIKTTVEKVVDYVDDELTVTTDGENTDWTIVDWSYLLDNGYISQEMYDGLENKNYTILVTEAFKNITAEPGNNAKTIYMHVSKLLGNQENEYTYENHVEIIQIGGQIARTIKEVEDDGTQVQKEYIPGNYEPTDASRIHEPDDDRIIAKITPPTGLLDNIGTYIIILVISLLVIGIGTYIIKKRVLGK